MIYFFTVNFNITRISSADVATHAYRELVHPPLNPDLEEKYSYLRYSKR